MQTGIIFPLCIHSMLNDTEKSKLSRIIFIFYILISAYDFVVTCLHFNNHVSSQSGSLFVVNYQCMLQYRYYILKNRTEWFNITIVHNLYHSFSSEFIIIRSASSSSLHAHRRISDKIIHVFSRQQYVTNERTMEIRYNLHKFN
jgi:hypothetical protein